MKIRMSPNIAVRHTDYAAAVDFYSKVLGFKNRSSDPALADFLGGVFDDIWKKQDRRLGDDTPATVKRWFDDAG